MFVEVLMFELGDNGLFGISVYVFIEEFFDIGIY